MRSMSAKGTRSQLAGHSELTRLPVDLRLPTCEANKKKVSQTAFALL